VLVLIFPVFGILAYLILRGGGMAARAAAFAAGGARPLRFVRQVGRGRPARPPIRSRRRRRLLDAGAIDRSEFERLKAKALQ
jgi:hypothetical protein